MKTSSAPAFNVTLFLIGYAVSLETTVRNSPSPVFMPIGLAMCCVFVTTGCVDSSISSTSNDATIDACRAAPLQISSLGLHSLLSVDGELITVDSGKTAATLAATFGMFEEPPTSSTSSMSRVSKPALATTDSTKADILVNTERPATSNRSLLIVEWKS
ncbi:hypothetical protein OGATHE_003795 [Ogataea polymorpha]|uniref:Uncharacterized protein n=1 Tax=Ogataea polymorpha TaxID=460523 RepID=A0A9P8P492_9ASCO|nr:hypothetical protein OGATHE_003795 [Ogataea polymorpha]